MKITKYLYFWVLLAIFAGVLIGHFAPDFGVKLKPLGDGFISLIKMLIGPIVFCTVVLGISGAGNMRKVGRVGVKALVYFEILSTVALLIGYFVVTTIKPGLGFNVDPASLDASKTTEFVKSAQEQGGFTEILMRIIPKTFFEAFTGSGDLLQILLLAILFGFALSRLKENGAVIHRFVEATLQIFFTILSALMKLAPLGAGGAMAFTVGKYGLHSLVPLASLMGCFYLTCVLFIFIVLGLVARVIGFNIWLFLKYIRDEIFLVLGTSSSESGLAQLMQKLEKLGCSKSVVGLVVPTGYSFNLDGTNIYITMAALFIAQALNVHLTLAQEISIIGVAMLTSKGASGVTGAGFVTLAATLAVVPDIPVTGLALILGVDRFMSEARALTNYIGNGVATLAISQWEGELNLEQLHSELKKGAG
jgi:aerobic C4-dicarboxylate transport protein